jgi:DNA end-binding protein Ku
MAWKGHITFGLISIPVRLYTAARKHPFALHQIHKECMTRIRQPLFCPTCNRRVDRSEIIKGYEYEKDQYALIEKEEIARIAPPSEKTMEIQEVVKLSEVDPLFFDASYLVVPEPAGRKAYRLLLKTLEQSGRAAIAKISMHQKEYLTIIRPREGGLTLHTMYYADEIHSVPEYGQKDHVEVKPQELKLAKQLVESLSAPFKPEQYHDEYRERMKALIESKQKGREVAAAPQPKLAPVVDIMEALKKSLARGSAPAAKQGAPPRKHPRRVAHAEIEKKAREKAS